MEPFATHFGGKQILITGGLGFLGSSIGIRLASLGAKVTVLDSIRPKTGANRANLRGFEDQIEVHIADVRDSETLGSLLEGKDFVFNLAGQVSHIDSMRDPMADLEANLHIHVLLLEACRRHAPGAKILFASTRQIYGRPDTCPVSESHPLRPVDVNGINKMAAETYHTLYHQVYGIRTVSLRLTNTFGPRMYIKDARQTFLGIWLRRLLEGDPFEVWGGQQKRDLAYVDDVVDAFLCAAISQQAEGHVFNIGGCPPVTLASLAQSLISIAGTGRCEVKEYPPELLRIDIGDYFADDRYFRHLTHWEPKVSLCDALRLTVNYYRAHLNDYV